MMPSCVAFTATERLIGDAAKSQAAMNPGNTIFGIQRLLGQEGVRQLECLSLFNDAAYSDIPACDAVASQQSSFVLLNSSHHANAVTSDPSTVF